MLAAVSIAVAAIAVAFLLGSARWTEQTYRRFERIPGHYDFNGKATRLDPRRQMAWLLPVLFSAILIVVTGLVLFLPADAQGDSAWPAVIFISLVFAGTQLSILHLLKRWAARQA